MTDTEESVIGLQEGIGCFIGRKIVSTLFSAIIVSLAFLLFTIDHSIFVYDRGVELFGFFLFLFIYIGLIILIYGNIVSIGTEYVLKKCFKPRNWLYVVILGIFGLANGILFQEMTFALYGLIAAVIYAVVDKCLEKRFLEEKSIKAFFLIPLASVL